VRIPALQPFTSADLAIPVSLLASVPRNTNLAITVSAVAEDTCDRNGVTAVLTTTAGLADAAIAARADDGEQNGVIAMYQAPATSLRSFDAAVCIANDTRQEP
jgi:hypothetical protein